MRTIVLIDGQNLYHLARRAWLSYDVEKLSRVLVSKTAGRTNAETRFYTGFPDPRTGPSAFFWHGFWSYKLRHLRTRPATWYPWATATGIP